MLALLTGARRSNVLAMRWRDIDMNEALWKIQAADAKGDEQMNIPLTPEAMAVLIQRRFNSDTSPWVFPAESKTGHYQEPKRAWATLQKRAELEDLRIHDLRRTMGSWLVRTGANTAINAKALGHKSMQAAAIYQRIADTDPVREAMEKATTAFMGGK
jgi:integrase